MSPDKSSQSPVMVKSGLSRQSTKISAIEEELLNVHNKILLHLRNDKPLTKLELRKLLAMVKKRDYSSPQDQRIAQSAQNILIKCIYSQKSTSEVLDPSLHRTTSQTSTDSSTNSDTEIPPNWSKDLDGNGLCDVRSAVDVPYESDNTLKYTLTDDAVEVRPTESQQYLTLTSRYLNGQHLCQANVNSALDLFSSQLSQGDEMVSLVNEMTLTNDNEAITNKTGSEIFGKQHEMSLNSTTRGFAEPFIVPTPIDQGYSLGDSSQQSNVLKLRLADVQCNSDSVSIPLELLTNLNFGSGEKSQGVAYRSIGSHAQNRHTSTITSAFQDENCITNTPSRQYSSLPSPFNPISESLPPSQHTNHEFSSNSINVIRDISRNTSFLTNVETPIEMEVIISGNTAKTKDAPNFKATSCLHSEEPYGQYIPEENTSNYLGTMDNSESFKHAWYIPRNTDSKKELSNANTENVDDAWHAHSSLGNATMSIENIQNVWSLPGKHIPDTKNIILDTQDLKQQGEEEDFVMTEAEKRYLEKVGNGSETETINFISDKQQSSDVFDEIDVNKSEQGSIVFNLDTDSTEMIEGTPFGSTRKHFKLPRGIKTIMPRRKPETQIIAKSPMTISETEDIIVDETLCSFNETPVIHQVNTSPSQSVKFEFRTQSPISKKHSLFNPYKSSPPSNNFQEMYKSNYNRKSKKTSDNSKIKNINIFVTQSQSFGVCTSPDQDSSSNKPSGLGNAVNLSSKQYFDNEISKSATKNQSNTSRNDGMLQSENIVFIDGITPKNTDKLDTDEPHEGDGGFEEKDRKLEEKLRQKRNKYADAWKDKPISDRVSLKFMRKFGVNIYEDPPSSLLNIGYNVNVNNFHFQRFTEKEMNEKLKKSHETADVLNRTLTKLIDAQISSSTSQECRLKTTNDRAGILDSDDSSDEDEENKEKRMLEEIQIMSRLERDKFMEEIDKTGKDVYQKKNISGMEKNKDLKDIQKQQSGKLTELFSKMVDDYSWLK